MKFVVIVRVAIVAALVVVSTVRPARASVLEAYAQIEGGGAFGTGISGAQKNNDFFSGAGGGLYGGKVGVEVLFTDAWVEHWQLTDFASVTGTWTQFMIGADVDFPVGDTAPGKKHKLFGEIGFGVGYGLGTGQQVEPPLDNAQVTDKGFIAQVSVGVDYRVSRVLSFGIAVPVTYGYLFKNGEGTAANDEENQYHQIAASPQLYLRLNLGFGR